MKRNLLLTLCTVPTYIITFPLKQTKIQCRFELVRYDIYICNLYFIHHKKLEWMHLQLFRDMPTQHMGNVHGHKVYTLYICRVENLAPEILK